MTWRVSARAVRSWQRLLGAPAGEDFRVAEQRLLAEAERVRLRYAGGGHEPEPARNHPGLYLVRGGLPLRLSLLVDWEAGEIADVLSIGGRRSAVESYRRELAGWAPAREVQAQGAPTRPQAQPREGGITSRERRRRARQIKFGHREE